METDVKDQKTWNHWAFLAHYHPGELGNLLGLTQRQLHRTIMKLFGLSPRRWLQSRRKAKTEDLLKLGWQVKNVHFQSGFKYEPNFLRWFKSVEGVTPRKFKTNATLYRKSKSKLDRAGNSPQ